MKLFFFLLSVTTSAFDPVEEGCKSCWEAYSSDSTLNDEERQSVIELINETSYFCFYEKLACDIRNNLTAVIRGHIPSDTEASLAKVFVGHKDYNVEIILKENLEAELTKFAEKDLVGCALGKSKPEGPGLRPAPANPKKPAKKKKKKNKKKKHSKRKMRMPTVRKIRRTRNKQPKKKNPPKKKKPSKKKSNNKKKGKNKRRKKEIMLPPKFPPLGPLPTEELIYYVCVH